MRRCSGPLLLRLVALVAAVLVAGTACGLPDEDRTRSVEDATVPYRLLDAQPADDEGPETAVADPPRQVPVVFWVRRDGRLTPSPVAASCTDSAADVVGAVLSALAASPSSEQRRAGWASAIPPAARLDLVAIDGPVAQVGFDPVVLGDPERLPLAVAQLALSVTSAPGIERLQVVVSGENVEVPLPDGALTDRPVGAADYASLLAPRFREQPGTGCVTSP